MGYSPDIFRAYDIRGIYPAELDEKVAEKLGRAMVEFLRADTIVLGRDMRLSSPALSEAFAKGVTSQGADVVSLGLCSTPMLYFATALYGHEGGAMTTASHNPKQWNGFKLSKKDAAPLYSENGTLELRRLVERSNFPKRHIGQRIETTVLDEYLGRVLELVPNQKILSGLTLVVDCGNGIGALTLRPLFESLGIKATFLNAKPDGHFPVHDPNPLKEENLRTLSLKVRQKRALLGIAPDGDFDRVGFVDERGDPVRGDLFTALLAPRILQDHPGAAVCYDLRSSRVVREEIEKAGGRPIETRVGHPFIKEAMRRHQAIFAGELSMHFYFKDFFYVENSDLAALALLHILAEEGKPLSALLEPLRRYAHSGEINFAVQDKEAILRKLEERYRHGNISKLDGLTVAFPDWWFNVRPSNTEPLLRLNLEAKDDTLLDEKVGQIRTIIEELSP